MKHIARLFIALMAVIVASPANGWADAVEFIPRLFSIGGDLDLIFLSETDDIHSDVRKNKTSDLFVKEKLSLYTDGFIYHPRFIQFHILLAGALKQEDYKTTFEHKRLHDSSMEYDFSAAILPEHPYNLYLFTRRLEPLYRQQFSTQSTAVEYSKGVSFRYKARPFKVYLQYIKNTAEADFSSYATTVYNAAGGYFKDFKETNFISRLTLNAAYDHSTYTSSSGVSGSKDEYGFNNLLRNHNISLDSSLSGNRFDQTSSGNNSVKINQFNWAERLHLKLPLNFRADVTYRLQKNDSTIGDSGQTAGQNISTTDKKFGTTVSHKLFQSLDTEYLFRYDDMASATGDTIVTTHSLSSNYTKAIPWGRLTAGINLSSTVVDRTGLTDIASEPHQSAVPGSFVLSSQNVDESTITIYLQSPVPPFELIRLNENIDYTVTPFGNTYQINLVNLPAPFVVPETYDFIVYYSLSSGDFKSRADSYGFNVNFNLFNNIVNPYYIHQTTKQKLLEGDMTGIPFDAKTDTVGIILQKEPCRVLGEYIRYDSTISPYTSWRIEFRYSGNITETSKLLAAVLYSSRNYPEGTSFEGGNAYTDRTGTISASLQKRFPMQNLIISAGGLYSQSRGFVDSTSKTLNSSLQWMFGKVTVRMGASASFSESQGTSTEKFSRTHQNYFINIKRNLF